MKLHHGDTSGSYLVYPGDIIAMRLGAYSPWRKTGFPSKTPMLVVPPLELTEAEIDGDAFVDACTIIFFCDRHGWSLAHRAARLVSEGKFDDALVALSGRGGDAFMLLGRDFPQQGGGRA